MAGNVTGLSRNIGQQCKTIPEKQTSQTKQTKSLFSNDGNERKVGCELEAEVSEDCFVEAEVDHSDTENGGRGREGEDETRPAKQQQQLQLGQILTQNMNSHGKMGFGFV